MAFQSLEDAVFNATSLADPVEYAMNSGDPNELFDDRQGHRITLLHYMAMAHSKPGVEAMLDIGADANLRASDGTTPLWVAAIVGDLDIVQCLIAKGADVRARGKQGDTPLHVALINRHLKVAQYLLDQGADPDAPNDLGISPRQLANFNQLLDLLE